MNFRLSRLAVRDLAEIGRFTRDTWNEKQAKRYREALTARFKWLTRNKSLWRARPELGDGLHSCAEQSHVIVFRQYSGGIEVLRVLHRRMDLKQHV